MTAIDTDYLDRLHAEAEETNAAVWLAVEELRDERDRLRDAVEKSKGTFVMIAAEAWADGDVAPIRRWAEDAIDALAPLLCPTGGTDG